MGSPRPPSLLLCFAGRAFEDLIQAAYELVQQGKPMEAEYILREGECIGGGVYSLTLICLRPASPCAPGFLHAPPPDASQLSVPFTVPGPISTGAKSAMQVLGEGRRWPRIFLCLPLSPIISPPSNPAGAKSAEQILGEGSAEVASLYDQLAMIAFFHDRSVLAQHST